MEIGLGSYAFRYAIGTENFTPPQSMNIDTFAKKAKSLGYTVIQLCENLNFKTMSDTELFAHAQYIKSLGLSVEIGMHTLNAKNLARHLHICRIFESRFLRVVIGSIGQTQEEIYQKAFTLLTQQRLFLANHCIKIGVENHFDLTTDRIVRLIEQCNCPWIGAICDTTNSIGFVETPLTTIQQLAPVAISLHLKDYIMEKAEASYIMNGTVLGQGQLDISTTLRTIQNANPQANCILELTIRRGSDETIEQTLYNEECYVLQSTAVLKQHLASHAI